MIPCPRAALFASLAACLVTSGLPVSAQEDIPKPAQEAIPELDEPPVIEFFTDSEFKAIADRLTGSWKSLAPVAGVDDDVPVVVTFAPINVPDLKDVIYSETARADEPERPYDVAVHRFLRTDRGIRLRSHRLPGTSEDNIRALAGAFALPAGFPQRLDPERLFPSLDYVVTPTEDGFEARTPHPFPSSSGGAVEYKGEIILKSDRLFLNERGYGVDGEIVWGASEATPFEKIDPVGKLRKLGDSLYAVTYDYGQGPFVRDGNYIVMHYTGYLPDGTVFDSSVARGEAFRYETPGRLIDGWKRAMRNVLAGSKHRVFIPPALAYGVRGTGRLIGPNQPIRFLIDVVAIEQ